ncbi:MAG: 3-coathanger stack domain-containing protein [Ferruginibacter sp.]
MPFKIKFQFLLLILISISFTGYGQETFKGITTGKIGNTNFSQIVAKELRNPPPKMYKDLPEEKEEDIEINNRVDLANVVPFSGKLTMLQTPQPTSVQEFPCNNFRALDDDGSSSPPDVNGAVGFNHLMATLNTQIRIQNKQGTIFTTASLAGFWNGLGGHTDIFDPKITYDPYDKRWIFVCCASRKSTNSALLLAVSETPDPNLGWTTYTIDADPADKLWFDYPSLGFNRNWITVGGYLFKIPGVTGAADTVSRSRVWVLNKAVIYAGNPNISVTYFDRTDYFHISPAITYDANNNTQWLISKFNNNFNNNGFLKLFTITGTQSAPVFTVGSSVNVGGAWAGTGPGGPQLGSANTLDLGDDRMLQSTFRGSTLWVGSNIFLPATTPTTCAAQVVAINTTNNTTIETIRTTGDANTMQAYPSITVNANSDIFFGYSTFRNNTYPAATISYRRNNGQGFFFYHYKAGEDWYVNLNSTSGLNRWGDYSATFVDPEDDMSAWTIQEYSRPRFGGNSFWGTWWAKICPGSCTNDFALSAPYNNVMRKYEANNTITSTAQLQSNSFIKYDAGTKITLSPGFKALLGNSFQAYIEGCGGIR